jgi:hypothetical protein
VLIINLYRLIPVLQKGWARMSNALREQFRHAGLWALSTLERAFFTFLASFFSALIFSGSFKISSADVALFAATAAALAVVTAAIRSLTPPSGNKPLDVVTRVGLTLVQAFTAAFVTTSAGATHFSDYRAGALAGVAALLTAVKGTAVASFWGKGATPASLTPSPSPRETSAARTPSLPTSPAPGSTTA